MAVDKRDLSAALTRGRRAVDSYIAEREAQHQTWHEEPATEQLRMAAWPELRYVEFNRVQEGRVGADWLWWWLDPTGACFGLLLQAKKLHRRQAGWIFDFKYPKGSGTQMQHLFETADLFDVAPAYLLICGGAHREGLGCGPLHTARPCTQCDKESVSVVAALVVRMIVLWSSLSYPGTSAFDAITQAIPLEDLVDPDGPQDPIRDLNLRHVGHELRSFLIERQLGPRQVGKLIFNGVSRMRSGQMTLVVDDVVGIGTERWFESFPADRGHFGVPYFEHVLRGLRRSLPSYAEAVAAGEPAPPWVEERIAGMVFVGP